VALKGRLGIDGARVAQADRHGVLWLGRGMLDVRDGVARFVTAGTDWLPAGDYALPFQQLSCVVLGPGTSVTHDVLRLFAAHGTGLVATGEDGVRLYASMPFGPDDSRRARRQVVLWSDEKARLLLARRMYAWRMGEIFPDASLEVLRGMEGARVKATYERLAQAYGISWRGRRYDRNDPESADPPNQAINHAATAVLSCASVATAVSGVIPQLGFIHEASGIAFCLDLADLFRDAVTVPAAFAAVKEHRSKPEESLERVVRRLVGKLARRTQLVAQMIDRIKEMLDEPGDDPRDAKRP
jgi:CRISPR-associated protein Cas1